MKTVAEILQRFNQQTDVRTDELVFHKKSLLQFVPFKQAFQHVEYKPTPAEWSEYYRRLTKANVIRTIREFMKYAWAQCLDRRTLEAKKSIAKFRVWLWILNENKLSAFLEDAKNYACHGAPMLKAICDRWNWDYHDFLPLFKEQLAEKLLQGERC